MTKEEIKEQIAECEERLKAEQERLAGLREELNNSRYSGKRWKPKYGDPYYLIMRSGKVNKYYFFNDEWDLNICAQGDCFKTKEEAEFEAERRKVITELSDFAEGDEAIWDTHTGHWCIYYDTFYKGISCVADFTCKVAELYFSSKEAAEAAIEAVGEDRIKKYYLKVKE